LVVGIAGSGEAIQDTISDRQRLPKTDPGDNALIVEKPSADCAEGFFVALCYLNRRKKGGTELTKETFA
jgi:hypothetical protein